MAWACAPKLDKAFEEMSGWFKDGGEKEQKADSKDFAYALSGTCQPHPWHAKGEAPCFEEAPEGNECNPAEAANCIYSTAKAVLEQSHQDFFQQLVCSDPHYAVLSSQLGHGGKEKEVPDHRSLGSLSQISTETPETEQSEASTLEMDIKKTGRSGGPSPVASCASSTSCLYAADNKLQEKQVKLQKFQMPQDKPEKHVPAFPSGEHVCERQTPRKTESLKGRSTDSQGYPKEPGRVRLRITPQHFSPLGTTFRDVQVDFFTASFTIRAIDCEGYAWTASSNNLPGRLAVDQCKFKINPNGKDVTISLSKADDDQQWRDMTRLELSRPYNQKGDLKHPRPPTENQTIPAHRSRPVPSRLQRNFI